ncbi:MAG: acyclic terpene utilization AtuA family protein [Polaromonas sp.]
MKTLRIGAGAGYSGDRIPPALELAENGKLDYLVFECLAERTIALAQLQRSQDARLGFDALLAARMRAVLPACATQGIKIISNMGAANPLAAGHEVIRVARELGIQKLKVAVVLGDDVLASIHAQDLPLMDSLDTLASLGESVISANAYIGAQGIVDALAQGADVVITGRVADPALFLAPLIHEFGWSMDDWDRLGKGTVVGHLLECAGQVTGGYFADPGYRDVPDLARLGFPLAEVASDGSAVITKVAGSGGCVTFQTCASQLLYEIENPAAYLQPDVVADFSNVILRQIGPDRVQVGGATGHQRPDKLKVTVGHRDGFIGEGQISYAGLGAQARGQLALDVLKIRLADVKALDSRFELIGSNAIHGENLAKGHEPYEVRARAAMRVTTRHEAELVAHEVEALYLNGPASGGGVTQSVREVIAAASVLIPREWVQTSVVMLEV